MTHAARVGIALLFALAMTLASAGLQAADSAKSGRDGWLVYQDNLADYHRANALSAADLNLIRGLTVKLRARLATSGSAFLWVVVPNTTTVYPESVPFKSQMVNAQAPREQLGALFAELAPDSYLDLTAAMLAEKGRQRLYAKTDTHWNDVGAYVGYRQILARLAKLAPQQAKHLQPVPLENFRQVSTTGKGGDLARMMGLQDVLVEESVTLVPKKARTAIVREYSVNDPGAAKPTPVAQPDWKTLLVHNEPACPGLKVLVYQDSVGEKLLPFLQEHLCSVTVVRWQSAGIDLAMIERERPDVVMVLNFERSLRSVISPVFAAVSRLR